MEIIVKLRELHKNSELTAGAVMLEIEARQKLLPTLVGWLYPGIVKDEIQELEAMQLSFHLDIWDQTVGCNHCGRADWAENSTDDPTLWHAPGCPCYGRRDVAGHWYDLEYVEREVLGRRCGL